MFEPDFHVTRLFKFTGDVDYIVFPEEDNVRRAGHEGQRAGFGFVSAAALAGEETGGEVEQLYEGWRL